jgi:hypothetical protein
MLRILLVILCTPLAGILAGFIYSITGMIKVRAIDSLDHALASMMLFGFWGSLLAAPTTMMGLPIAAVVLSPTDRRFPRKLTLIGFVLGWLTMMGWCVVLSAYRWPHRFHDLVEQIIVISAICSVGAICGALAGSLIAYSFKMEADERNT